MRTAEEVESLPARIWSMDSASASWRERPWRTKEPIISSSSVASGA